MPGKKAKLPGKLWFRRKASDETLARLAKLEMASGGSDKLEIVIQGLQDEIKQMREEFAGLMKTTVASFASQIDKKLDSLASDNKTIRNEMKGFQNEILKNSKEIKQMGTQVSEVSKQAKQNEAKIASQKQEIEALQKKVIYMEDNSRRQNVKIFNFEVTSDMKKEMELWINTVMGTQFVTGDDIERIHHVGKPRARFVRPVLVRFASYVKKEQFITAIRAKPELLKRGTREIQVYQDLSKETMEWRKSMRPITTVLMKNGLKYVWGFPMLLKIFKGPVLYKVSTLEDGQNLLTAWNLGEDQSSTEMGVASSSGKP